LHRHTVTRVLPYAPEQLFDLVGDVEAYPKFVPWITGMRTWNAREDGAVSTVDAEAQVGFSFLREKFATRVRRDREALSIDVSLLYGPFKRLINGWRFVPEIGNGDGATRIEFVIDFAFKAALLDAMLAANIDKAANKLIACFEDRARQVYGVKPAPSL
jgi:coenzyme Q-binding protein COQ10